MKIDRGRARGGEKACKKKGRTSDFLGTGTESDLRSQCRSPGIRKCALPKFGEGNP